MSNTENEKFLDFARKFQIDVFNIVKANKNIKRSLIENLENNPKEDLTINFLCFLARMPKRLEINEVLNLYAQINGNKDNINEMWEFHTPDVWENVLGREIKPTIGYCYYANIINETPSFIFTNGSQILFTQTQGCTVLLSNREIEDYKPKILGKIYDKSVILAKLNNYLNEKNLISISQKYTTDNMGSYSRYDNETKQIHMVAKLREEDTNNAWFVEYLVLCIIRDYAMYELSRDIVSQMDFNLNTNSLCKFQDNVPASEYDYLANISALIVATYFDFDILEKTNLIIFRDSDYFGRVFNFKIDNMLAIKLKIQANNSEETCLFADRLNLARDVAYRIIDLIKEFVE